MGAFVAIITRLPRLILNLLLIALIGLMLLLMWAPGYLGAPQEGPRRPERRQRGGPPRPPRVEVMPQQFIVPFASDTAVQPRRGEQANA